MGGGGEEGQSPKKIFRPFGGQFSLKRREGLGPPGPPLDQPSDLEYYTYTIEYLLYFVNYLIARLSPLLPVMLFISLQGAGHG